MRAGALEEAFRVILSNKNATRPPAAGKLTGPMPHPKSKGEGGLDRYYQKRSADTTPEPFGTVTTQQTIFVVQKHHARRLHWDLRLEMDGVLRSWAVPRGPSFDPSVKRLAVRVEDHPLEYAHFEGIIPKGNYGAGAMIVWDRGIWVPLEDPKEGVRQGKLLFELQGFKLRGRWTLVKTKGAGENDWLLIKKTDRWSFEEGTQSVGQTSILSGRTIEDLEQGLSAKDEILERLDSLGAKPGRVTGAGMKPMLAELSETAFSSPDWLFELKYDGFRLIAEKKESSVFLFYRSGKDATRVFPDIVRALVALPYERFLMDGEIVVLDDDAKPSFQRLQRRVQLLRNRDIEGAALSLPATLFAFDLLGFGALDLRSLSLVERKSVLKTVLPPLGPIRFADHVDERGEELFREVQKIDLEGIIAKRKDSKYTAGRSSDWRKIRRERTEDFVVIGYLQPKRETRPGFSGLHLGTYRDGRLAYAGRVGSGFSARELESLRKTLDKKPRTSPAVTLDVPRSPRDVWTEPHIVVEVRYLEKTEEGLLRQPVFLRVREDKTLDDLKPEKGAPTDTSGPSAGPDDIEHNPSALQTEQNAPDRTDRKKVPFTNLDKVFWPEDGTTKGDLIEYYRQASPWLLPYLKDRPVVLTRYPDGITGKNFFQKDAPPFIPGWVRTERMWSEHAKREIDYFVADDEATLLYLINLGSIPLHVWSSRIAQLQNPDWTILDLDPKGAPFEHVIQIALAIRELCDQIRLPTYVKTSGSSGLHVLIPLGAELTYQQGRALAELIARVIVQEHPKIATVTRNIEHREGRVYLDYLQNGHGRLLVSPLSVRPIPGAPLSMPLQWSEVCEGLSAQAFTIKNAIKRLKSLQTDPFLPILSDTPKLKAALNRLGERHGLP